MFRLGLKLNIKKGIDFSSRRVSARAFSIKPSCFSEQNNIVAIESIENESPTAHGRKIPEKKQYLMHGYKQLLENGQLLVYQHNNFAVKEYRALQLLASKKGFKIRACRAGIMRAALKNGPFDAMTPLFEGPAFVFYNCAENGAAVSSIASVKAMFDILLKQPKLLFLGAKIETLLFSKDSFLKLSKISPLPQLQSQLLGALSSGGSRLTNLLDSEGQLLTRLLKQHIETPQE